MASYPATLLISDGSTMTQRDDLTVDRATNGAARVRAYFSARKREFVVRHAYITLAERNTLLSFYDSNRLLTVTLAWMDGTTYTCVFSAAPKTEPVIGDLWNCESRLVEA